MQMIAKARAALSCIALSMMAGSVGAGTDFTPVQTLAQDARVDLGFAPAKVELRDNLAFVIGVDRNDQQVLQVRDTQTLDRTAGIMLDFVADDIVADQVKEAIYVIGNNGRTSQLRVYDFALTQIGELTIPRRLSYPVLSITPNGLLIIGSLRSDYSDGFFGALSVQNPQKPQIESQIRAPEAWRGVTGAWMDAESLTLFMNASWDAELLAMTVTKGDVVSVFSEVVSGKLMRDAYTTFPLLGHQQCRDGKGTSFLVADMSRGILSLVDYNAFFESLDTQAFVEFSLAPTRATVGTLPGTDIREPLGVMSSSCDQSVVLLGSRTSFEVDQFARNNGLSTLEHVGSITLPFLPTDIDVSPDGAFALAVSGRYEQILRLTNTASGGATRIIGDPQVRELQRILTEAGLPVGSIDGIIGARTLRAVSIAEERFDIDLDLRNDVAASINTLSEAIKINTKQ